MRSGKSAERYDKLLGTFWVLDLDHDVVAVGLLEVIRFVDLCTGRMWYNTRMILKDDPKAYAIMGCAMRVHSILGHGFLESAYGDAL